MYVIYVFTYNYQADAVEQIETKLYFISWFDNQ